MPNVQRPEWVRLTDHPVIVRTRYSTTGSLNFEGASPHLTGENRDVFIAALRSDLSACAVERAQRVFRHIPRNESVIAPETCTPYLEANGFGFYIKNELPLVFVRTSKGDLLPDARVAVKYMRENESKFKDVLNILERNAPRIFRSEVYATLKARYPILFSDVAQPYASFSNAHMAMRIGCYAMTPPGIALILGPPINQRPLLPLHAGLMESEWHHSELFIVFDCPNFVGQVLVIEPGTTLAQLYFVAIDANEQSEVLFSEYDQGAEPTYRSRSIEAGLQMLEDKREFVLSRMTGTKSVSVACPHCWVSVTAAAEGGVPEDHVQVQDFYPGYKILRAEYHDTPRERKAGRDEDHGN
jgi:hypothetical protein